MSGNTLAEGDGMGNLTAEYIYLDDMRVARVDLPANTVHYYPSDHLGSTSLVAIAPSQTVFSIGYDFHAGNGTAGTGADNGNVWAIYNYRDRTRDQSFTYDPLNRLTSAQNAGANCAATTANGRTEYW